MKTSVIGGLKGVKGVGCRGSRGKKQSRHDKTYTLQNTAVVSIVAIRVRVLAKNTSREINALFIIYFGRG